MPDIYYMEGIVFVTCNTLVFGLLRGFDLAMKDCCDGIFVTDGYWLHSIQVMQRMLQGIHAVTGMSCYFVVCPGASFHDNSYMKMLHNVKSIFGWWYRPRFIIWLLSGYGDYYPLDTVPDRVYPYDQSRNSFVAEHANELLIRARRYVQEQCLVWGFSPEILQYDKKFTNGQTDMYTLNVSKVVAYVKHNSKGKAMSGMRIFKNLPLTSKGIVAEEGINDLLTVYITLTKWGMFDTGRTYSEYLRDLVSHVAWYGAPVVAMMAWYGPPAVPLRAML